LAGPKVVNTNSERTDVLLGPVPTVGEMDICRGKVRCPICGFVCEKGRGIAVHTRRKHPSSYHAVKSPAAGSKARWDPEERYLLAKRRGTSKCARMSGT
jgi:hypothetical protein